MNEMLKEESKEQEVSAENNLQTGIVLQKGHFAKAVEIIGAILLVIGCFVPLYQVSLLGITKNVLYIEGDGIIVCFCAVLIIVLTLLSKQIMSLFPIVGSAIVIGYTIISFLNASENQFGSWGVGLLFLILGVIIMIIGAILAVVWKTDNLSKKSNIVSVVLIIITIVLMLEFARVSKEFQKKSEYNAALNYMKEKQYSEAIDAFRSLGEYKDSVKNIKECQYLQGKVLLKEQHFDDAKKLFMELEGCKGYSDSVDLIVYCDYEHAESEMANGSYKNALKILENISEYEDAQLLMEECYFNLSQQEYFESEDLSKLITDVTKKCPNYKKAKKFVEKEISNKLEYYDSFEDYQEALKFLKKISKKWNVKKERKKIEEKIKEMEEKQRQQIYELYGLSSIDYVDLAGQYYGMENSNAYISIYSSREGNGVGNIELFLSNETYKEVSYRGILVEVSSNLLKLENNQGKKIILGFNYNYDTDTATFDLYENDKKVGEFSQTEHYYS